MNDYLGNKLEIDDIVIMIAKGNRRFQLAKVISFSRLGVDVWAKHYDGGFYKSLKLNQCPSQLIKIPKNTDTSNIY